MSEGKVVEVECIKVPGYIAGAKTTLRKELAEEYEEKGWLKITGELKVANKAAPAPVGKKGDPAKGGE